VADTDNRKSGTRRSTSSIHTWAKTQASRGEAASVASSAGRRKGTSASAARAAAAMSGQSVLTMTRVMERTDRQASMARAMSGTPFTVRRALRGTPREPPRAAMTATTSQSARGMFTSRRAGSDRRW